MTVKRILTVLDVLSPLYTFSNLSLSLNLYFTFCSSPSLKQKRKKIISLFLKVSSERIFFIYFFFFVRSQALTYCITRLFSELNKASCFIINTRRILTFTVLMLTRTFKLTAILYSFYLLQYLL